MSFIDDNIQKLKLQVLYHVAKACFENNLDEVIDTIPHKIIPGNKAKYRCCVYKEREILSQRVRMACGKVPINDNIDTTRSSNEIVYVIHTACEGCPISRFVVTDNCQNCISKRCQAVCPFGAISTDGKKAYINKELCRECGKCKDACPFSAIADFARPCIKSCAVKAISVDEDKKAVIDYSKCIKCGNCVIQCPFGAISDISYIVDVIELLKGQDPVYAIIAPSIQEQFPNSNLEDIKDAFKLLGFTHVVEAADSVQEIVGEDVKEYEKKLKDNLLISSCCPSFVKLIKNNYKSLKDNISSSQSPMIKTANKIKQQDPKAHTVFIGPCIAKKDEAITDLQKLIDYVLTYEELFALLKAKEVYPKEIEKADRNLTSGRVIAKSGGLANLLKEDMLKQDENFSAVICSGTEECKKALLLASKQRLGTNFIEGMACNKGCMGGPCYVKNTKHLK